MITQKHIYTLIDNSITLVIEKLHSISRHVQPLPQSLLSNCYQVLSMHQISLNPLEESSPLEPESWTSLSTVCMILPNNLIEPEPTPFVLLL
jgi:hypothetical protein